MNRWDSKDGIVDGKVIELEEYRAAGNAYGTGDVHDCDKTWMAEERSVSDLVKIAMVRDYDCGMYAADMHGVDMYGAEMYGAEMYGASMYGGDMYDMEQEDEYDEYDEPQQKYLHGMIGSIGYVLTLVVYIVFHCSLTMQGQVLILLGWMVIDFVIYLLYTAMRKYAPIRHKNWGIRLIHMNRYGRVIHGL